MKKALVTGAGGFIGHHLVKYLKSNGYWVRGVDLRHPEFGPSPADEFIIMDLREFQNCVRCCEGINEVYQLAADMGGIGYITAYHAGVARNNTLINMHMLEAARQNKISKYLFTSSACVYPQYLQKETKARLLKEEDAYPADAEPGYGWEKLFTELACQYYKEDYGLQTYIVRFHNIFGPLGIYDGGREKSPAAICRKIALAKDNDEIEVWGDGKQTRSYCYIDDCIEGIFKIMQSDYHSPLNLGQDKSVSIDELVDIVTRIAGKKITKKHNLTKPQGVRGRSADISLIKKLLGWCPKVSLEEGLDLTYKWVHEQLVETGKIIK